MAKEDYGKEDYSEPWDSQPTPLARPRSGDNRERDTASINQDKSGGGTADDYCDPWDSKKQERKDDYSDPWDAKKPSPKSRSSAESQERESDEDSYSEPYDTGKITVLDEHKRMSLKGKRQSNPNPVPRDNVYDRVYQTDTKKQQKIKASKKLSAGNDEVFREDLAKK